MRSCLKIIAITSLIVGGLMTGLYFWWMAGERERVHDAVIASAHLAPIPDRSYRASTAGNVFNRSYWLDFSCSEADFQSFIEASPGLKEIVPYYFPHSEKDPLPTTFDRPPDNERESMQEYDYFWETDTPGWDQKRQRQRGRRYEIHLRKEAIHGYLLRDDETGEVSLRISYS